MRIRMLLSLTAALLALASAAASQQSSPLVAGDLVLRGGLLFDGIGDRTVPNTGIVIRNGTLLEVGASLDGRDLSAARVLDLEPHETVLPGLFDLHAHYAMDLFGEGRVDETEINPIIFLANGVTSTFPGGEVNPDEMRSLREQIDSGRRIGPRIYNSGPYFGTARPGWSNAGMTADRIRRDVDEWAARGARGFKAKGIRPEHLQPLIEQAHRHGLTVTAHLDSGFRNSVNPATAILMGIDRIEHFMGGEAISADRPAYASLESLDVTRPEVRATFELYLRRGVFYDATISAYGYWARRDPEVFAYWMDEKDFFTRHARRAIEARLPRRVMEQFERIYWVKRKEIKAFYDAGGKHLITLGTDHPSWGEYLSGFGAHRELHVLTLAGIPAADALKIGTINGARAMNAASKLGTIEPGKFADLFVVRGNPLEDIRHTRNVRWVVKAGELHSAAELLESAKGRMGPASLEEEKRWRPQGARR